MHHFIRLTLDSELTKNGMEEILIIYYFLMFQGVVSTIS